MRENTLYKSTRPNGLSPCIGVSLVYSDKFEASARVLTGWHNSRLPSKYSSSMFIRYLRCPPGVRNGIRWPSRSIRRSVDKLMPRYSAASLAFRSGYLSCSISAPRSFGADCRGVTRGWTKSSPAIWRDLTGFDTPCTFSGRIQAVLCIL